MASATDIRANGRGYPALASKSSAVGRPRKLAPLDEAEAVVLVERGIRRDTVARVFNVSPRTVDRLVARQRDRTLSIDEELAEALALVPTMQEVLADAPTVRAPRRRRSGRWRAAAAALEQADAEPGWGTSIDG